MKIQFDVKYRPQIESGEYKVETRIGESARILCWDFKSPDKMRPIAVAITSNSKEGICTFPSSGKFFLNGDVCSDDLFIITPEPEIPQEIKDLAKNDDELNIAAKVYEATKKLIEQDIPKPIDVDGVPEPKMNAAWEIYHREYVVKQEITNVRFCFLTAYKIGYKNGYNKALKEIK